MSVRCLPTSKYSFLTGTHGLSKTEEEPDRLNRGGGARYTGPPELDVRVVVTLMDFPAGQPLVTVPLSAGITLEDTTPCPFPPILLMRRHGMHVLGVRSDCAQRMYCANFRTKLWWSDLSHDENFVLTNGRECFRS